MPKKTDAGTASNTIDAYRKRQQRGPVIIWGLAVLLVLVGIIVLVVWFVGSGNKPAMPKISLFATETATPTLTYTPTVTSSPTATSTMTMTPTMTLTPTPSAPFSHIVQEGESFDAIKEKYALGDDGILLLLALNPEAAARGFVFVGEEILVPNPGMELPTATPVPVDLPKGTELQYTILPGDSIAAIAAKFRSTEDAILELNEIENANTIQAGQTIIVPANLVTPAPTRLPPTSPADVTPTPVAGSAATPAPTKQAAAGTTASTANCTYQENRDYVAQIFDLVNTERVSQGLKPLAENPSLSAAALAQASDMACNNFWKTTGSDGSTLKDRLTAQGYNATFSDIQVHAQPPEYSGDGKAAVNAWLAADNLLLSPKATELGIGYAYYRQSAYGGYFTIILAAPAK
jgi:uncharacterized protein YkwD